MKRPKRKQSSDVQYLLFEDMIVDVEKTDDSIIETQNSLLTKYPTKLIDSSDVGLETNKIYCGDTVETMGKINEGTIDLILTSPPYLASIRNDNHKYPGAKDQIKDNQSVDDYLEWIIDNFKQYERILKKDGVIVFNFSYTTFNPSLPYFLINEVFKHTDFRIYDTFAWKKKSAMPVSGHPNRVTRIVEMVYIFAKTPYFKANKTVSSVSRTGQKYYNNYYNFIEARNNDGKVEGHEATFSTDLASFFIDLYSKENEIVLDNFSGTGTTPYASSKMNRQYIGIDLVEKFCDYARERVSKLYKEEGLIS
jgi:DNA modification methylase